MPASQLEAGDQPSANRAMAAQPKKGAAKLTNPTTSTSFHRVRMVAGSSSAPARKVRTTAPVLAMKTSHGCLAPSASGPK